MGIPWFEHEVYQGPRVARRHFTDCFQVVGVLGDRRPISAVGQTPPSGFATATAELASIADASAANCWHVAGCRTLPHYSGDGTSLDFHGAGFS
jgi:hypothetical protein